MIVDFQHHFTPRELIKEDPGDRLILNYDASGAPSYTIHSLLYDLDEHVRMMDTAGIDAAWLTSAAGMCADLDTSRLVNDKAKQAERDYPGRFIGAAHAHPLGGGAAFKELARCRHELGFQGVTIASEFDGKWIDDPALEPFWDEVCKLGLFVFVHPALKLNHAQQFDAYDTARGVGREFSLIMATIRLVNSGVFDRHPELTVHMAHLSGNPRHGATPKHDFDHYIRNNLVFDTAGFAGGIGAVKAGLCEIPAARIVFATDYPQEIRKREIVRDFVRDIRGLGADGERILSGNVGLLLKQ
jgi:predicted TIM-barrel fold metal-dependent hydrolase